MILFNKLIITGLIIGTLLSDDVLTQATESNYYLGFFKNYRGGSPSIIIMTTESQPVSYSIEIPGIGYYHSGTITANNEKIVNLKSVDSEVLSHDDQDKGIYLKTSSDRVTVIGQNVRSGSGDTFLALPITSLCVEEYVYYGMSVRTAGFYSSILIVGTENNTMMKLTVTQPVTIKVDDTYTNLISDRQYSFVINRLQTVYVRSLEDLTGTKIVTNKPVSVFSGHQMGVDFEHHIEQVPPTTLWGRVYYTVPLATRRSYTIKVLAAYDSTNVDIYCNNSRRSYAINEGEFVNRSLSLQEYCVIQSNKKTFVAQFALDQSDGGTGDPMMTVIPATNHYTNNVIFTTLRNHKSSSYRHYVNIIVLAQYYQPDMIHLISGGVKKLLDTQEWVPIKVNNVIEAYATKVSISEGVVEIVHTNTSALMTTIVYGFTKSEGYGNPGGLAYQAGCSCTFPTITTHPSSHVIRLSANKHNLSLTCEADGATSYNWERQSGSIPSGAIGVNTNTLTIINLQPEDAGNYRCVATNDCGTNYSNYAAFSVRGEEFYLSFYKNVGGTGNPSIIIMTTESQPVSYSIEIPGIRYYYNGTVTANNEDIVDLPGSVVVLSHDDQDKGIYLKTSSDRVAVIGQNVEKASSDTYFALSISHLCIKEYVYYGMSAPRTTVHNIHYYSSILIVGTENNTMMKLTVPQPVTIKVDDTDTILTSGRQYSFVINRLQTVYVRSLEDLTGTKIVTNKPVSVFSGHECGNVPWNVAHCDYLIEQVPPTTLWGRVYYTAPLATRRSYTMKVLAAYNSTIADIFCSDDSRRSYTINEGEFVNILLKSQEYCAIQSNKEVLVFQFSHGRQEDSKGDPMMTLVPATIHYLNKFIFSTIHNSDDSNYKHFVNIIVVEQYYQPNMIYLISGGVNKSLDTQEWIPIKVNNVIEAYATIVTISEDVVEIIHTNTSALMTTIVYGFVLKQSYGHPGVLKGHACYIPIITTHPSSHVIRLSTNNHNLSLTCEADGATSYNWERQSGSIPSGAIGVNTNTLTIINLQPEDAGNYRCVATNNYGTNYSNYAAISVRVVSLLITAHPTDMSAAAPFSGVFTCSASGYGYPNITWYRTPGLLPDKSRTSEVYLPEVTTSTLVIPNVTNDDVGSYYCVVRANSLGAWSSVAKLSYASTPAKPMAQVLPSQMISLTVNNFTMSMRCIPDQQDLNYVWEKRNENLPSRAQGVHSSTLTIINLKPEDSGEYRCVVSNSTGKIASEYQPVTIKVSLTVMITQPKPTTVHVYDTATFQCTGRSYGKVTITWKKLMSKLPVTATVNITKISKNEVTSILTIDKSIGYYKGNYYCVIENDVGKVNSTFAYCDVTVPCPEIIQPPQPVIVRPGNMVTFSCLAWSFGGLEYKWTKNNNTLPLNTSVSFQDGIVFPMDTSCTTTMYQFRMSKIQTADEGLYCCVASNECGKTTECAKLEVDTTPSITVQPQSDVFKNNDRNLMVFEVVATGMGPISYLWEKHQSFSNSWIRPSSRVVSVTSSKLIFSVITEEDEGTYRCIVTNDDGSVVSDNVNITVYGPPTIVHITDDSVVFEGNKTTLMCNATNDEDAVNPLTIAWYNSEGEKVESNDEHILALSTTDPVTGQVQSVLLFDPVNHTDGGEYTCHAFNDNDCYTEDKTILTVKSLPVIIEQPLFNICKINSKSCELKCFATGIGHIQYKWEKYQSSSNSWRTPSHRAVNITSPTLIVSGITEEDEGDYRCIAQNHDGRVVSNSAAFTVYGPPVINFIINNTITFEGNKVNLICNATNDVDAINPLSIDWYNSEGVKLQADNMRIIVYNTTDPVTGQVLSVLLFDRVNHTDSGEYTCHAFNDNDCYTEAKTNLTIEYAPIISIDPPPPYITDVGGFLLLLCSAKGLPIPTVQWYKGSSPIGDLSDKIYYVPTVSPHTTVYTCVSRNKAGGEIRTVKANITVIVQSPPPPCPSIAPPENGSLFFFNERKNAVFYCDTCYDIKGSRILICTDGQWNLPPPKCVKVC